MVAGRGAKISASFFAEKAFQFAQRRLDGRRIRRRPGGLSRSKMVAKIGASFVSDFLRRGFATMFGDAHVVFDAHFADVQFTAALRTFVESTQGQAESGQ